MERPRIALVCADPSLRLAAAAAFDTAPPEWEVTLHHEPPPGADLVVAVGDACEADVRVDPGRTEDVVAKVRSALEATATDVIAVVGASGGCGATSIALHLAAQGTGRACVMDLQARPSCAVRMGLEPEDLSATAGPVSVAGGFALTFAAPGVAAERLSALRREFARVIVDCPPAVLPELVDQCDAVVLVITPTIGSATAAAGLLDALGEVPVAVATNRLGPGGETTRAELQRILGRRVALELPCSRGLRDSEDDSCLLTSPWSPWLRRVTRLSMALER